MGLEICSGDLTVSNFLFSSGRQEGFAGFYWSGKSGEFCFCGGWCCLGIVMRGICRGGGGGEVEVSMGIFGGKERKKKLGFSISILVSVSVLRIRDFGYAGEGWV